MNLGTAELRTRMAGGVRAGGGRPPRLLDSDSGQWEVYSCMVQQTEELKVDRTVVAVTNLGEDDEDQYWRSRTSLERLAAIETNRQVVYGYLTTPPRLQRLLEIAGR